MNKLLIVFSILVLSCSKDRLKDPLPVKQNQNLKYFGFSLIDVGWDDPADSETKTNYIDEVASFSNVADILVLAPTDNVVSRMQAFEQMEVKVILHLSEIFFELVSTGGTKSGVIYGLRDDYKERWDLFITENNIAVNYQLISCFYIGEEPAWNGISAEEFTAACDYAKLTTPEVPILNVEAYLDVENIYTPGSVDWVGFDHYFLQQPSTDSEYINELATVKSKLKSHQKIFLIMDSHWIKLFHGSGGIAKTDLDFIARDYYQMANADTSIIGILGYFWPSGFDIKGSTGARHLPVNVLEEYQNIGKVITGK